MDTSSAISPYFLAYKAAQVKLGDKSSYYVTSPSATCCSTRPMSTICEGLWVWSGPSVSCRARSAGVAVAHAAGTELVDTADRPRPLSQLADRTESAICVNYSQLFTGCSLRSANAHAHIEQEQRKAGGFAADPV